MSIQSRKWEVFEEYSYFEAEVSGVTLGKPRAHSPFPHHLNHRTKKREFGKLFLASRLPKFSSDNEGDHYIL